MRRASAIILAGAFLVSSCATGPTAPPAPVQHELPSSSVSVTWEPPPTSGELAASVDTATVGLTTAFDSARERAEGWQSLPQDKSWRAIISRKGVEELSLSIGTTSSGVLQESARLPAKGVGHQIIERHQGYGTSYGTPELVAAISNAAIAVADAYPGAILRVGNLSRKRGGDIPWSHSHNSGRDADLAFYVHRADTGEVVPAPDLMHFGEDLLAREDPGYVFDVPRNWELTSALLKDESINIQWIFISIPLKEALLEHARETGESEEIIRRASEVLHQPTDALPHDDHFHLRIGCSREDRLEGCIDWGPRWDWADWHMDALKARSLSIAQVFESSDATVEDKLAALTFLEEISSPYRAEVALVWGVWDESDEVRDQALTMADNAWPWSSVALVAAQRFIESDRSTLAEKAEAYSILRRAMDPIGWTYAKARLEDESVPAAEKVYAARSLEHAMNAELVPFLIEQLAVQPAVVRAELASVLQRVTNHTVAIEWSNDAEATAGVTAWRDWWSENRFAARADWLLAGFASHGIELDPTLGPDAVDKLLPLLRSAPEHVIYNVNRLVREVTGRWAPLEQVNGVRLYDYWMKWWRKNRFRLVDES